MLMSVLESSSGGINSLTETFVTRKQGTGSLMKCRKNMQNYKKQTFPLGSGIFCISDLQ